MKVYVVLRPETEWQEFIGVFSTRERANEIAFKHSDPPSARWGDTCAVVEYEIDSEPLDPQRSQD
jgi:hypothetical protein